MNGDTPINPYEPQFPQREAAELSGADMSAINNWISRGDYKLAEIKDKRLKGRRFFSIADIAALHAMHYCVNHLDMRPAAAGVAGRIVYDAFGNGSVAGDQSEDGTRKFNFWHLIHKTPFQEGLSIQRIWQDRKTGAFYHYDPVAYPEEEPFGFPHFPCLSIPTSAFARRIFLKCADYLVAESEGEGAGDASEGEGSDA